MIKSKNLLAGKYYSFDVIDLNPKAFPSSIYDNSDINSLKLNNSMFYRILFIYYELFCYSLFAFFFFVEPPSVIRVSLFLLLRALHIPKDFSTSPGEKK